MESLWWELHFQESYSRFCKIFKSVIAVSFTLRVILSLLYSFNHGFGSPHGEFLCFVIFITILLEKLKSTSIFIQQLILYSLIECLNISLQSSSKFVSASDAVLFCLESTLITIYFQTNIFKNIYLNALIAVKHLVLWFFCNKDFDLYTSHVSSVGICIVILSVWIMFERDKRKCLFETNVAKKAEKKANKQFSELLMAFPDGLVIFSSKLEVLYINESIKEMLKCDLNSISDSLKNIVFTGSNIDFFSIMNSIEFEHKITPLGISTTNEKQYEWNGKKITWQDQECTMIIVKDVTAILSYERIAAENRSKNALIRSVSHELRTPINGIFLMLEQLIKEVPKKLQESFDILYSCVKLLNFQISDIIDYSDLFSNRFSLKEKTCDIKQALNECVKLIEVQAEYKGLKFLVDIDSNISYQMPFDCLRLQKVVINLLNNAVKYTQKGSIELIASIISVDRIKIIVRDTGIGIPANRLPDIFNLFSDQSESSPSGLGLHISNSILKYFNSTLIVESTVNKGTSFSFVFGKDQTPKEFQLTDMHDIPTEPPKNIIRTFTGRNKKIRYAKVLIVDDHDLNRMCLSTILKRHEIHYIEAINGEEAVNLVRSCDWIGEPIECIIMDCYMPVMDGWEASKAIHKMKENKIINSHPCIIGYTAYSSDDDINKCRESGMDDCIFKPSPEHEIISIIKKYLSL